ncbi:MAG TPA: sugar phosphate isomerase/epimerase family protein [Candidatus Hydrogenedentes bacterium]|nr:sugar phosphate isomerase/epimerase family protein [Candidatus Hydrogenedentota bacterium]HPG69237.1 sugar phosphate isomerase/epimerase family protein [Candidatus Hydrogenedentota bacterium]
MLSITSDYAQDVGCPEPYLRRIAEAGFSHVHWCHQWNTDFLYAPSEIAQIGRWFEDFGLTLNDLHASDGKEKCWVSLREYERLAGVELVRNRIEMAGWLGSDVIIMHMGSVPDDEDTEKRYWEQLWKSLDNLEPVARKNGIRIAIENGRFAPIRRVLDRYPADYVGLCYDCGHGNVSGDGLDETDALKDRLLAIHLHDNDGTGDQHKLLFMGTVDWPRLARILAKSAYRKCVSMEVSMRRSGIEDETAFLNKAFETGTTFAQMVDQERAAG